jgi:hypothetical protein
MAETFLLALQDDLLLGLESSLVGLFIADDAGRVMDEAKDACESNARKAVLAGDGTDADAVVAWESQRDGGEYGVTADGTFAYRVFPVGANDTAGRVA